MDIKNIFKRIIYYLSVPKCIKCSEILDFEDKALCKSCLREYYEIKQKKCSECKKLYSECLCVNDYLFNRKVHKLVKIFRYKPPATPNERISANELIYQLKRNYRKDIVDFLSDELVNSIKASGIKYEKFLITNIPRSKARVVKYGLDHSEKIAKALAKKLNIEYIKILKSNSKKAQKKTFGDERYSNVSYSLIDEGINLEGEKIFILDDIVTTGASMGQAGILIKSLGAKQIVGIAVAIAYKDKYIPFDVTDRFS